MNQQLSTAVEELQLAAQSYLTDLLSSPNRAAAVGFAQKILRLRELSADPYRDGKYADLAEACIAYLKDHLNAERNWKAVRREIERAA